MTPEWVLDASVALSWVVPSQATEAGDALLQRAGELKFVAPRHFSLEILSGLLKAERRDRATEAETAASLSLIEGLTITFEDHFGEARLQSASTLARTHALSIYDGLYLDVALRRRALVASRDKRLLEAARNVRLDIYDALGVHA